MGQFLSSLVSTFTTVLPRVLAKVTTKTASYGIMRAGQISNKNLVSPKTVITFGGLAISFASIISWVLFLVAWMMLLPILLFALQKFVTGLGLILRRWERTVHTKAKGTVFSKLFHLAVRVVPETLGQFLNLFVLALAKNIVAFVCILSFIFIFVYFVERHMNQSIEFICDVSDLGIHSLNFGGHILGVLFEIRNVLLPITNMITRSQIMVAMHIYDGLVMTIDSMSQFSGRRLSELGADMFFLRLESLIQLGQMIYNVDLAITTTVIDLFFATRILNIIVFLADTLTIIISKTLCMLAGRWCTIQAMLDFFINDLILGFLNILAGIFGASIPLVPGIMCTTVQLEQIGITHACFGTVFSPSGFFASAPSSNHRRLISCEENQGRYFEYVHDVRVHSTSNQTEACPHARTSFHAYGNSLNMEVLDTHECYDICVLDVLFESCPDGSKTFKGPCEESLEEFLTPPRARRRLDEFFSLESNLRHKTEALFPPGALLSRPEMVETLRAKVGASIFSMEHGKCDLSSPPTDIYEILYDGVCVASRLWDMAPDTNGRRLSEEPSAISSAARDALPWLSGFRHHMRTLSTRINLDHPASSLDSSLLLLKHHLDTILPQTVQCPGKYNCRGKCVPKAADCPHEPYRRRRLDKSCAPGLHLCPNERDCKEKVEDCPLEESLSVLGRVRSWLYAGSSFVQSIDIGDIFYDIYLCWKGLRDNPERDPYHSSNLKADLADLKTRCEWCIPMWEPSSWEFVPYNYSLRTVIYDSCIAESSDFKACQCPMFYELPSTSQPWNDFISYDLLLVLLNGAIWFKTVFAVVTFDVFGYLWSSFFSQPTFSREWSMLLSLYSTEISSEMYWICQGTHTGSACVFLLVLAFVVQLVRFTYRMMQFFMSGGMTYRERVTAAIGRDLGLDDVEARISALEESQHSLKKQ